MCGNGPKASRFRLSLLPRSLCPHLFPAPCAPRSCASRVSISTRKPRRFLEMSRVRRFALLRRVTGRSTEENLDKVDARVRFLNGLSDDEPIYFFHVDRGDASNFEDTLRVRGSRLGNTRCSKQRVRSGRELVRRTILDRAGTEKRVRSARRFPMDGRESDSESLLFCFPWRRGYRAFSA